MAIIASNGHMQTATTDGTGNPLCPVTRDGQPWQWGMEATHWCTAPWQTFAHPIHLPCTTPLYAMGLKAVNGTASDQRPQVGKRGPLPCLRPHALMPCLLLRLAVVCSSAPGPHPLPRGSEWCAQPCHSVPVPFSAPSLSTNTRQSVGQCPKFLTFQKGVVGKKGCPCYIPPSISQA